MSGSIGRGDFQASTKARCNCYCKDNQALCMPNGSPRCTSLFADDTGNCGACGRTCAAKSVCRGGTCSCPNDQCGDRCVSLKDNPNNCGKCGNACGKGEACYQGQCYLPPPDKCAPVEGFSDGGSLQSWSITDKKNDGFTCPICPYYTGSPTESCKFDKNGYGAIGTTVHMCPGTDYDLSFQTRHGDGISINCQMKYKFGNKDWSSLQGVPTGGPTYERCTGSPNYRISGFQKGESGTTLNDLSLDVPFQAYMTCGGQTFSLAINYFSLVPAA